MNNILGRTIDESRKQQHQTTNIPYNQCTLLIMGVVIFLKVRKHMKTSKLQLNN